VLETGAGTGIVTRCLHDLLPATTRPVATDLNPPMLDVARTKFRPDEPVEFQDADAIALPFADGSFDAVVCQFGARAATSDHVLHSANHRLPELRPRHAVTPGRYIFHSDSEGREVGGDTLINR
jgi:SAM-dependent methyltransferase